MTPELTQRDLVDAIDGVVLELLEAARIVDPPVDSLVVANRLGLSVTTDERQTGRARFVRLGGRRRSIEQGSIIVRPDPRPERVQWAVAHEIGEASAGQAFASLQLDHGTVDQATREKVANELANRLLLPHGWFERDAVALDWDLRELKSIYFTASHELIARRMLECSPEVIITIFDNGRVTTRLSNVPGRVPPLSQPERIAWQHCHEAAEAIRQETSFGRVEAWPVHEPSWQREILRTALCDADYAFD